MKAKPMPSLDLLNALFDLDSECGVLIRKRTWTNHKAGEVCGTKMNSGHLQTCVEKKRYLVHRIVYFMATGVDPADMVVDHINGIPDDNRIENLRLATRKDNSRHKVALSSANKSGHRNVSWNSREKRWQVSVKVGNRAIQRTFKDIKDAAKCAQDMRVALFGEFHGLTA